MFLGLCLPKPLKPRIDTLNLKCSLGLVDIGSSRSTSNVQDKILAQACKVLSQLSSLITDLVQVGKLPIIVLILLKPQSVRKLAQHGYE